MQMRSRKAAQMQRKIAIGPGERKLIVLFLLFLLFQASIVVQSTLAIVHQKRLSLELETYFLCEAGGHVPGKCGRSGFEALVYPIFEGTVNLLLSLIPFSVLSFVIDWQKCLTMCQSLGK